MSDKTWGFKTKRSLPALPGRPAVCKKCDLWFLAGPRERTCTGCLPRFLRAKRATHPVTPGSPRSAVKAKVDTLKSSVLGLTFRPGIPVHRMLAIEAAAEERWATPAKVSRSAFGTAHEPDCPCEPCDAPRPAEYRRAHAAA